jgi:polyhydroxyalkanoate synthesis regulator protein
MNKNEIDNTIQSILTGEKYHIDDYFGGEMITIGFDKQVGRFYVQRIDTVVGSYNDTNYCTQAEVEAILRRTD